MEIKKRENIGWVDFLRVMACFLVVFSHCCDPFVAQFDTDKTAFLSGVMCGSFVRACVPLFVMMTGVLLFPVRLEMGAFYKKRITRIIIPLIFWSIALPVIYFFYLNSGITTHSPSLDQSTYTLSNLWNKLYTFIFNFNYDTTPLWYLYMLVGLYFLIPVFSAWLKDAPQKDIRLFLYIWGITLVIPYLKMLAPVLGYKGNYGNMGLFGECDWNVYGTFYYVSGFIGYLVLAYYLVKYPLSWSWKKTLGIGIPMFLVGYAVTFVGFLITQQHFPGNYAYLEIVWYFAGINVFMMTFPVFIIVQKSRIAPSRWLSRWASLTFGIYLCHFVIVQMGYDLITSFISLPPVLTIVLMACFAFLVSSAIVWIMEKFSLTKRLVM